MLIYDKIKPEWSDDMKEIKLIALDLDGTALRSDSTLSDKVKLSIQAAYEAGIMVAIASGRPFRSLPEQLTSMEEVGYAIVSNGAGAYSLETGERLFSETLEPETVKKAVQASLDMNLIPEFFCNGSAYAEREYIKAPEKYGRSLQFAEYVRTTREPFDDMQEFAAQHENEFDSIAFVCPDPVKKKAAMDRLKAIMPEAYITTSGGDLIEIMHSNATKSGGLRRLCGILGIHPSETAAFGNGDNDADMLSFAGTGFAMEDGSEMCRNAADHIIPCCDMDGTAKGIDMILKGEY